MPLTPYWSTLSEIPCIMMKLLDRNVTIRLKQYFKTVEMVTKDYLLKELYLKNEGLIFPFLHRTSSK